jgi:hypothetical protein
MMWAREELSQRTVWWRLLGMRSFVCVLASPLLPIGCGRVETEVGAQLSRDSGAEPSGAGISPQADAGLCALPSDASPCTGDLSDIGTGDFHISLTLTTTQQGWAALVNQRSSCGGGMFWDVRINSGQLVVETDDGVFGPEASSEGPRATLAPDVVVNDGKPHCIRIERVAEMLSIAVDGVVAGSASSVSSFAKLPPLATGTDPCDCADEGCVPPEGAFLGAIAELCVGSPSQADE